MKGIFSKRPKRSAGTAVAALLCLALTIAPMAQALDYSTTGLGNKHSDDGFQGFGGFGDEVGGARDQARDRAADSQKEGDGQMGRARNLKDTGDQIGKDRNQLLPQVQQAKQQDQRNSSGSSSLQKVLQKPYTPPKKYEKAMQALGLSRNHELYYKGPEVQKKLYSKAEELSELAHKTYEKAAQGFQAAKQLQSFQQIASARAAAMRNLPTVQGAANKLAAHGRNGGLDIGANGSSESYGGSVASDKIGSGISDRSTPGPESDGSATAAFRGGGGGSRGLASAAFDGKIDMKMKGAAEAAKGGAEGAPEKKGEPKQSLEKSFAALDALFDQVAGKPSEKPGTSLASALGAGGSSPAEPMETLKEVLQISEPETPGPETAPAQPALLAVIDRVSGEQGNGFILEEENLFQRVRQSYLRASREGRISGP